MKTDTAAVPELGRARGAAMTIRQQTHLELEDLGPAFREAVLAVWAEYGLDAARCFALGA